MLRFGSVWFSAKTSLFVGLLIGFIPLIGEAQQPISLSRVLQLARERAPAIAAARGRLLAAEGQKFSASVPPDPEVTGGYARGKPREGGPSAPESSFAVDQFLPSPRTVRARIRAGDFDIEAAREDVSVAVADVLLDATRLYYEAAIADAEARALSEAAKDAQSLRDVMDRRVELGEASEGDRLRTRVEARRTELEARGAAARAEANRAVLNRFLLGGLGANFALAADLDATDLPPTPENLMDLALERNPDYRAAQKRVEAAGWTLSAERAARLPGLAVSLFRDKELDKRSTGLTLGLTIPLWNRNQGGVLIARGELAELDAEARELRARIEAEVERLSSADRIARELAIAYRREILPDAAEALSIVRFSLDHGEANLLAWLEARRSYLEILRASYEAEREAFLTRAELTRLTGVLDVQ